MPIFMLFLQRFVSKSAETWKSGEMGEWRGWRVFLRHPQLDTGQGKSEGFDSCDRPSNVTQTEFDSLIFRPVWPWNLMDDLENHRTSLLYYIKFVHHFKAIGEFKLELQVRNIQFGSKSAIFGPVWPWKLMHDHEKQDRRWNAEQPSTFLDP